MKMFRQIAIDYDKIFNDFREELYHGIVNESSLIYKVNDGKIKGELAIPGFKKEELTIRAHPKFIDISGKMEKARYRRISQSFHQKVNFNKRIDPETIKISFENGVLSFEVALEEAKEVKIVDF